VAQTTLAGKPRVLFLLFGDRADPRLLPLATLTEGRVTPITLDAAGWRGFDGLYFKSGARMALFQNGRPIGDATVRRGMWEGNREPLYKLPGCRAVRPLAAAKLSAAPSGAFMLELLAMSDPLPAAPERPATTRADVDTARALAERTAQREGLTKSARAELDLVASAFHTGATGRPTLVASYVEQGAASARSARHVLVIGDASAPTGSYAATYVHVAEGAVPEIRRLIDHADITGDGVDEIVLEALRADGESYLVVMSHADGKWREIARGATSWCVDAPR
jgi:hypothetical protein